MAVLFSALIIPFTSILAASPTGENIVNEPDKLKGSKTSSLVTEEQNVQLLPLRSVMEQMGVKEIIWKEDEQKSVFIWEGQEYELQVGLQEVFVDGTPVPLSIQPVNINNKIMVPLDFFATKTNHEMKLPVTQLVSRQTDLHSTKVSGEDTSVAVDYNKDSKTDIENKENLKRQKIVETAKKYLGVPYKWGGDESRGL